MFKCNPPSPAPNWSRLTSPGPAPLAALILLSVQLSAFPAQALPSAPNSDTLPPSASQPPAGQAASQSGFGPLDPSPLPNGLTPEALIAKFGARESAFAAARNEYTFRQSVIIQTINDDTHKPDGSYSQVTDIVFTENGARTEHVVNAPANTIERVVMTENDFDDIVHRLPFVLTTPELPQYNLTYLGRQRVDDIETYVFDCKPRELVKGKRYFQGKVWVDQQQFEIVLINGKSVPDNLKRGHEDLSPPFTTYYQEVDGGNWFPVYTKADGVLHFPPDGPNPANDVHMRSVIKYEDYKRFHAKSRIIYNGEALPATTPNTATPSTDTQSPAPDTPATQPPPDPDAPNLKRVPPK